MRNNLFNIIKLNLTEIDILKQLTILKLRIIHEKWNLIYRIFLTISKHIFFVTTRLIVAIF